MFGRRRDIQIPKVPVSGDKATQSWMTAVGSMLSKYIGGGSNDRLVSAGELIDAGLAGTGTGGFLTSPPRNLTKPPKVTGLTANGALASIFVSWHNPSFSNYGYTELWRSNLDDIGQAVLIASTAVESYTDNVGSAATKYYWARAVSDQGVKGDFNAASGTKGTTSLDPDYVMQVLTSSTWKPNTTYYPFQYVRPTTDNGFQYAAVDGGTSGSTEPTWPTTINATVNDGTIQWITVPVDARIPFVLGTLEDGTPAVFMDTAYIKNASITSAKIGNLIADKITTGDLNADLHVLNKLWYGFNLPNGDFLDPEDNSIVSGKTGFYLGTNGSGGLPVLHLNTGIANESKSLFFDGIDLKIENVDILSSADGTFDDLAVDSLTANRTYTTHLGFANLFAVSDHVSLDAKGRPTIDGDQFDPRNYFCWVYGSLKTRTDNSGYVMLGDGNSDYNGRAGIRFQGYANEGIVPFDFADPNTKYRMKKKAISFRILLSGFNSVYGIALPVSRLNVYIMDSTDGFPQQLVPVTQSETAAGFSGNYLAKGDLSFFPDTEGTVQFKNMLGQNIFTASVFVEPDRTVTTQGGSGPTTIFTTFTSIVRGDSVLLVCETDNEALGYSGVRRLKAGIEYNLWPFVGDSEDHDRFGDVRLDFQLIDKPLEFNAVSDVVLDIPVA